MFSFETFIVTKILNELYDELKKKLGDNGYQLKIVYSDFESILERHYDYVLNWCSEISFLGLETAKRFDDTYVKVLLLLQPRKFRFNLFKNQRILDVDELFGKHQNNIVILGDPGAGKTTLLKYIANKIAYDSEFYPELFQFPVIIRLKEIRTDDSLILKLTGLLGIRIETDKSLKFDNEILITAIATVVPKLKCLLLFDGLDEVEDYSTRVKVVRELEKLSLSLPNTSFLLTCRSGDFNSNIANTNVVEIKMLDDKVIYHFIQRWIAHESDAPLVYKQVTNKSYKYLAVKPLTLAHLCTIFNQSGEIPEKPVFLYRIYVDLMLHEWDKQNNIDRISKYGNFNNEEKLRFLSNLTFEYIRKYNLDHFTKKELEYVYCNICNDYGLPETDAIAVVNEIESHTGLFIQTGRDRFEFAHKTLREYIISEFFALNLKRLEIEEFMSFPNETATAIILSNNVSDSFLRLIEQTGFPDFYNSYFNRNGTNIYIFVLKDKTIIPQKNNPFNQEVLSFLNTCIYRVYAEDPVLENSDGLFLWILALFTVSSIYEDVNNPFSKVTRNYLLGIYNHPAFKSSRLKIRDYYEYPRHNLKTEIRRKNVSLIPIVKKKDVKKSLPNFLCLPKTQGMKKKQIVERNEGH